MTEFQYRCSRCSRTYGRDEVRYLCPECGRAYAPGMPLVGVLEVELDYRAIAERFQRARPDWDLFSPVEREHFPVYPAGGTPFAPAPRLGERLGWPRLWIKNDGLNPSGSLKDRASFLVVAEAARLNEETIVAASTGNAASSLAAVCAAAGRRAVIFVPQSAPRAKLVQMLICGARVIPVRGSYDDAFRLSLGIHAAARRPEPQHRLPPVDDRGQKDRRPGDLRPERHARPRRHPGAGGRRRDHQRHL